MRARRGETSAFEELVRRYRPRIFALALHVTGCESDADDVAQEVFLRAFRSMGDFEGRGEFFHWIYRIALRLSFDVRRERARRPRAASDDPRVVRAVAVDAGGDPRKAAYLHQLYRRLVPALDRLSPTLRATVILVSLQGLTHQQAAEVLGTTPGTIAWRVHEARAQLEAALGKPAPRRLPPPPEPTAVRRPTTPPPPLPRPLGPPPRVPTDEESGPLDLSSLSRWYS
jgi:RNA polymerase sigma-70 factor (ECF subfamily)